MEHPPFWRMVHGDVVQPSRTAVWEDPALESKPMPVRIEPSRSIETKRDIEKKMVSEMIALYCRKKHHHPEGLCEECQELTRYACMRSDRCPFMETKTFCANCHVHCYKPVMRQKIQEVMRFSGPRMLLVHPIACIRHLISTKMEKRRLKKQARKSGGPSKQAA